MTDAPVPYAADVEQLRDNEDEVIEQLCATFDTILETTAEDYGHAVRSVHAKAHGILEGTLTIDHGLPPELAQGLFATPGEHKVVLRLSTNPGDILTDKISVPRGLAIKVLDVEGDRLPGAEGRTQDFIMVNGTAFQARNAEKFLGSLKLLAKTTDKAESGKVALSAVLRGLNAAMATVGVESPTVQSLGGAPNVDPLGETYYSVTPFRYGDYIAKFSLAPIVPELSDLAGEIVDTSDSPDAIRQNVQAEMAEIDGKWAFRVQLCRNLDKQPVEDPTVEWDEDEAPFHRVAILSVPRQDSWNEARVQQVNEEMRFSIWTGLAAHRPLGNINRARNAPYAHSAKFRERFNGCPIHEPA